MARLPLIKKLVDAECVSGCFTRSSRISTTTKQVPLYRYLMEHISVMAQSLHDSVTCHSGFRCSDVSSINICEILLRTFLCFQSGRRFVLAFLCLLHKFKFPFGISDLHNVHVGVQIVQL